MQPSGCVPFGVPPASGGIFLSLHHDKQHLNHHGKNQQQRRPPRRGTLPRRQGNPKQCTRHPRRDEEGEDRDRRHDTRDGRIQPGGKKNKDVGCCTTASPRTTEVCGDGAGISVRQRETMAEGLLRGAHHYLRGAHRCGHATQQVPKDGSRAGGCCSQPEGPHRTG